MGATDAVWMVMILAGTGWLLYRSLWKKKGHYGGCSGGSCGEEKKFKAGQGQWPIAQREEWICSGRN